MKICRFSRNGEVTFGVMDGELDDPAVTVTPIVGHPFAPVSPAGPPVPLTEVNLLSPVLPNKVIGIGKNYAEHAKELGGEVPPEPTIFLKPPTSVIGTRSVIVHPTQSTEVHHEAELAVVISRLCREVPVERAHEVILGYTCANDVTARDLQRSDGQWTRAKGFDTFCPLGPYVETDLDPSNLRITCMVGTEVRQDSRTSEMVRGVPELVAFVSSVMTLLPGDVILTGTPAGVSRVQPGDVVVVSIEGIGPLTNLVADASEIAARAGAAAGGAPAATANGVAAE